jgi:hypothetical protein
MRTAKIVLMSIALGFLMTEAIARAQQSDKEVGALFELYSWQDSNGTWSFCVLVSPSGVNISAKQIFDERFRLRGMKQLKAKIARLPAGATIYWMNRISGAVEETPGTPKLTLPPPAMIEDIRNYAKAHKIDLEMTPSQPGPK